MTRVGTVDVPLDLESPLWGKPAWPAHFRTMRSHQVQAIGEVLSYFNSGTDVVILNAPTGSGKTFVAEAVRRLLNPGRALYCPDTKILQDQVMGDFGQYARLLKGRANYPTGDRPELFNDRWNPLSAADCMKKKAQLPACGSCTRSSETAVLHCSHCHPLPSLSCPYEIAKREALNSPLAVLNTSYFIAEANGPASFGYNATVGTPDQLVIFDEADQLEGVLMNQVEVFISARRIAEFGLEMPKKKTVEASWLLWVNEEAIPKIKRLLDQTNGKINLGDLSSDTLKQARYLTNLHDRLHLLRQSLIAGNAVYDGYDEGNIRFQPVNVAPFGQTMLWRHANKFLLMSATIIDPYQMVEDLGIIDAGLRWDVVNVGSTFPKENRPIHVVHGANMVWKERETEWPKMAVMVRRVLDEKHPNDRVLIHTVSYEFTRYLYEWLRNLGRPVLLYNEAKERDNTLAMYKKLEGAVLLAPSMDRGISLDDELCRAVIICKMPFASLKDKRVAARMYGSKGSRWYGVQTVRKLVQASGRGVRSREDTCSTWILDSQFVSNVWKNNRDLLPEWWRDALDWSGGGLLG